MAMEVLRSQDCLVDRFRTHLSDVFPRRRNPYGAGRNGRSGRKPVNRLEKKRYNGPTEPRRSRSEENLRSSCGNNNSGGGGLISGQVTILKRGESLDSRIRSLEMKKKKESDAVAMMLCGAGRLGPEPEAVPKKEMEAFLTGRRDMYAGSALVVSPSPSDLPMPSFPKKKLQLSPVVADDLATRNLLRLLGLK